ncbi:MAG: peptide chain release factor N(5)-glutamine methyltransferase [Actinobacteria bacterium]|nr:peptide chain release factor N(5)-glutamine methyltransferase [Actinomycetota bacterium]
MTTALRTVRESVGDVAADLERAGCESARLDAELLVAAALGAGGRDRVHLEAGQPMSADAEASLAALAARRAAREPVAYILGRREFRRLDIAVDRRVLIPRPETELLVEAAIDLPRGARVHDVGTGSGAIALAIKDERADLVVTGSDSSAAAVEVARANAQLLGLDVEFECAADLPPGAEGADLVVANLPYVAEAEWEALAPEITAYEPRDALVAGPTGLEVIEQLVAAAPAGTAVAVEHAPWQAGPVRSLMAAARTLRDLARHERVTIGRLP